MTLVYIMIGGGIGALLRSLITTLINQNYRPSFPYATLIINCIGCFVFGMLSPVLISQSDIYFFILVGTLGGFTTFSTLQLELITQINNKKWRQCSLLFLAQYVGCFACYVLGYAFIHILP
ncbi:fluoride efflux transporter FluC [Staphylococcus ratti]|uniref:Fluoride-specific ion channel FluC n=1 Tax=Staphylococcus ratti TaxID=2892440 RepID=A0ABY3PF21_9STAP|nr:CrcB family protein [Staphylococcus ratti]UEX90897.1 CrcB family protein [Staphylococcus ratti]